MSFVHLDNLQRLNQFWNQCSNSSLHGYQGTDSCLRGNVEPFFVTVFLQEAMTPISIFHLTRPGEVCWYFPFEINEQRVLPAFLVSIKLMWCPIFTPRQILGIWYSSKSVTLSLDHQVQSSPLHCCIYAFYSRARNFNGMCPNEVRRKRKT